MKVVRARLDHRIDDPTGRAAVLGAVSRDLHADRGGGGGGQVEAELAAAPGLADVDALDERAHFIGQTPWRGHEDRPMFLQRSIRSLYWGVGLSNREVRAAPEKWRLGRVGLATAASLRASALPWARSSTRALPARRVSPAPRRGDGGGGGNRTHVRETRREGSTCVAFTRSVAAGLGRRPPRPTV